MTVACISTAVSGLVLLLTLSLNIGEAEALQCFVCNSKQNASCAISPPKQAYIKTCDQEQNVEGIPYTVCRLMVVERNGETTVDRRCGWIQHRNKDTCITEPRVDIKSINCECHTELCNAAPSNSVHMFTLLACSAGILLASVFGRM